MQNKTLIINPPVEKDFDRNGRWPAKSPLGTVIEPFFLAYAAAVLEKEELPVELIDCRPYYLSQEELLKKFDENTALAVLQTSTASIAFDLDTARKIKNSFQKVKIALVGSHVSILDKEILEENKFIDFVARGEYEYTIRDLAKNMEPKSILGITYRENGEIIRNADRPYIENLDELPFPARHFLPMECYSEAIFKSKRTFRLAGSRGCPYRCTFCLWTQTMYGRKVRFRDPKKVADEIEHLIKVYSAKGLYFEDDTLTVSPKHVMGICDEMLKRKIKIPWSCMGRVDTVNLEMLKKMREAGCYTIRYGVESSSQEILDLSKKGITIEQVVKARELTKKAGIEFHAAYTFGLPGETKETIAKTIKFAIKLDSDYAQFATAMPYPGTELYETAVKNGWLKAGNWSDFEASENSVLEYPNLKAKDILEAHRMAYKTFYLRPGYIIKTIFKIRSFQELLKFIRGAINLLTIKTNVK